jgi:hypothetical protein
MPYVVVWPQHAEQLNRSIMRLLRPSHLRGDGWTDLYCGMVTHPTLGYKALCLPDNETVPLHVESDGAELAAMMEVFVADQAITQEEANGIVGAVQAMSGQRVRIADFIPPSWSGNVFTAEEMQEQGWFPAWPQ